jgi:cytochrome c-type biogenesis protein CcmF
MVIYFVAFAGMAFKVTQEVTLSPGESTEIRSPFGHTWKLTSLGVSQYEALNRVVSAATLELSIDGKPMGRINSEKRQHVDSFGAKTFEPSTEVGIRSDLREDLYEVYAGSIDGTEKSSFAISVNPLVWWVWFGGVVLVVGGIITMWPGGGVGQPAARRQSAQSGYSASLAGTTADS